MRKYIKGNARAAVMLLKRGSAADFERVDAIDAHNRAIAESLYNAIMNDSINHAYQREGKRLIVYTKSLRGNYIQASYFWEFNGGMEATMHTDIINPGKMESTFIPARYINIVAA